MPEGTFLLFKYRRWNGSVKRAHWLRLLGDGRLYVGEGSRFGFGKRKPSDDKVACVIDGATLEKVRHRAKEAGFLDLDSSYGNEVESSRVGYSFELMVRDRGHGKTVKVHNPRRSPVPERLLEIVDPLKVCGATLTPKVPFWREIID